MQNWRKEKKKKLEKYWNKAGGNLNMLADRDSWIKREERAKEKRDIEKEYVRKD